MTFPRRMLFVYGLTGLMLVAIVLLTVVGSFTLELFVLISLTGTLLLAEYTAPVNVTPMWRRRLRLITVSGIMIFAAIVLHWVMSNLPEEVPL